MAERTQLRDELGVELGGRERREGKEIVLLINLDTWAASVDRSNKAALPGTAP